MINNNFYTEVLAKIPNFDTFVVVLADILSELSETEYISNKIKSIQSEIETLQEKIDNLEKEIKFQEMLINSKQAGIIQNEQKKKDYIYKIITMLSSKTAYIDDVTFLR